MEEEEKPKDNTQHPAPTLTSSQDLIDENEIDRQTNSSTISRHNENEGVEEEDDKAKEDADDKFEDISKPSTQAQHPPTTQISTLTPSPPLPPPIPPLTSPEKEIESQFTSNSADNQNDGLHKDDATDDNEIDNSITDWNRHTITFTNKDRMSTESYERSRTILEILQTASSKNKAIYNEEEETNTNLSCPTQQCCLKPASNDSEYGLSVPERNMQNKTSEVIDTDEQTYSNSFEITRDQSEPNNCKDSQRICQYFINSRCRYGDACKDFHPPTSRKKQPPTTKLVLEKQGLHNVSKNMCFAIAPIHMLATTLPDNMMKKRGNLNDILWDTMRSIKGKRTVEEVETLSKTVWELIKTECPEFVRDEETSEQGDTTEFLLKLLETNEDLYKYTSTVIETANTCNNPCCHKTRKTIEDTENVIRTNYMTQERELLQTVLNRKLLDEERNECPICHGTETLSKIVKKAPEMMIIQVPRSKQNGTKIETELMCPTGSIEVMEKEQKVKYNIHGVITHNGDLSENGHYTSSYYDNKIRGWLTLDDDRIRREDDKENLTKGTIFILLRVHDDNTNEDYTRSKIRNIRNQSRIPNQNHTNSYKPTLDPWKKINKHNEEQSHDDKEFPPLRYSSKESKVNNIDEASWVTQSSKVYSNQRYYVDRDMPQKQYQKICWWHNRGICKFGEDCHYTHVDQYPQPFRNVAQRD